MCPRHSCVRKKNTNSRPRGGGNLACTTGQSQRAQRMWMTSRQARPPTHRPPPCAAHNDLLSRLYFGWPAELVLKRPNQPDRRPMSLNAAQAVGQWPFNQD
ncbi:hypothetical protein BaRGS_00019594 [Batillaria attramentaria]|uniref:Uncharacterized protein n=1 Tax=Batillaria attramentaria TaxID=370345 RepID=A0ABD0KQI9_9CAEN